MKSVSEGTPSHDPLTIHIDGAARGNPGPAAIAFVIAGKLGAPIEEAACLGSATNNVAKYTALLRALQKAQELTRGALTIYSDSELLVKQMNGEYKVKNPDLQQLYVQAKQLAKGFAGITLRHVPRAQNSRADQLCNDALDGQLGKSAPKKTTAAPARSPRRDAAQADLLDCLRTVAAAWSRGQTDRPSPADVCEQLWSVLEEHNVLRS